ncbi:MAG: SDR family NAD(P)-dependent oxidoreductase, partial [Chitinivibrionales bacterium]|nr:SDR family NAD(P)-dependent oxidoreductase [Chitinivibrionales bacterium]
MKLDEAVVVVTGAGSGIGRAIAIACGAAGAQVVCCGRRLEPLQETVAAITADAGSAEAVPLDTTNFGRVQGAADTVLERHGRIDVLINNAGRFASVAPLWEADPENWWQDVTVNLLGT